MNPVKVGDLLPLTFSGTAAEAAVRPAEGEAGDTAYRAKVEAAAQKFEGFFITQMLRQMRSATRELAGEDSIYKNRANDDMLDLADTTVADALAGQRAFGIADAILRQLLPAQPASSPAGAESAPQSFKFRAR